MSTTFNPKPDGHFRFFNRSVMSGLVALGVAVLSTIIGPAHIADRGWSTFSMLAWLMLGPLLAAAAYTIVTPLYQRQINRTRSTPANKGRFEPLWLVWGLAFATLYLVAAFIINWANVSFGPYNWFVAHFKFGLVVLLILGFVSYWVVLYRLVRGHKKNGRKKKARRARRRWIGFALLWFALGLPGMWLMASIHSYNMYH